MDRESRYKLMDRESRYKLMDRESRYKLMDRDSRYNLNLLISLDMYNYNDKPQMGPNSSDEEEDESELPPPSMPPPRLPPQTATVATSNPPLPRPEAPCPSTAFRIAGPQNEACSSLDYSSQGSVNPQTNETQQTFPHNASVSDLISVSDVFFLVYERHSLVASENCSRIAYQSIEIRF